MAIPPSISTAVERELWGRPSERNPAKRPKKQIRIPPNPFSLENLCGSKSPSVCSRSFLSQYGHLLRSSLVSRDTRHKGRVVKSAGIRSYRELQARTVGITAPGVDGVVVDKAQTHCPRLERLVPKVLKNRKRLDTYELLK